VLDLYRDRSRAPFSRRCCDRVQQIAPAVAAALRGLAVDTRERPMGGVRPCSPGAALRGTGLRAVAAAGVGLGQPDGHVHKVCRTAIGRRSPTAAPQSALVPRSDPHYGLAVASPVLTAGLAVFSLDRLRPVASHLGALELESLVR
jgi:hypothetical protein